MRILSVVIIKAYSRYGYDYLKEIILRRVDYQEYTIAEKDFKNLYPSDFEDLNLLLLQGHLNHLPGSDKRMLFTLNLTKPGWDAKGFEYKHDYTIIESPRVVVFPVSNNERKIMRFNEIYKFSDDTLTHILEALDYRVKEYKWPSIKVKELHEQIIQDFKIKKEHLDVKTAFLHGNLKEEICMLQPEGFKQKGIENLVCRLNKSLYGLNQAPRCWYKRFDSFIRSLRYNRLHADPCAYFKRFGNNDFIILLLYVDDMLVAGPNKDRINKLKAQLAREFEMKDLGPANKILRMQLHRDRVSRKIWLSQKSYVQKILQRFNMQDCKPISTPFPTNVKLSSKMSPSNEKERMEMSRVPYASAVGTLMFAMICTRPDIAHAVGVVNWYIAEPGREHWEAVKRVLRYIKGTSYVALCFGESDLIVKGYVDSD
ncbi:retrovirus-related pol polyprotein from transposon TNT 1-94 [Tanacetum coccineum]|uniref:Retrovirus-related pol polyprotein from transposon TNT 1-94 n=1 Tax=Tanacetum coccineum TaxID=301880 RepID=A0ABQ4XYI7_9ASTR